MILYVVNVYFAKQVDFLPGILSVVIAKSTPPIGTSAIPKQLYNLVKYNVYGLK